VSDLDVFTAKADKPERVSQSEHMQVAVYVLDVRVVSPYDTNRDPVQVLHSDPAPLSPQEDMHSIHQTELQSLECLAIPLQHMFFHQVAQLVKQRKFYLETAIHHHFVDALLSFDLHSRI
jgi:hypothetical protein